MKSLKYIICSVGILVFSISKAQYVGVNQVEIIPSNPTDEDSIKVAVEVAIASIDVVQRNFFQTGREIKYEFCYSNSHNLGGAIIRDTFPLKQIQSGTYIYKIVIYESSDNSTCIPVDSTITTDSFYVASAVSLPEQQILQKLRIYPNPANDYLNITTLDNLELKEIEIHDIQGKLMQTKTLVESSKNELSLDVGKLPAGIYIVVFKTDKGKASKQFVLE